MTYPLRQIVPLGQAFQKQVWLQRNTDLAQELIATELVTVPHTYPELVATQLHVAQNIAERLIKLRLNCRLLNRRLALVVLILIARYQIDLNIWIACFVSYWRQILTAYDLHIQIGALPLVVEPDLYAPLDSQVRSVVGYVHASTGALAFE